MAFNLNILIILISCLILGSLKGGLVFQISFIFVFSLIIILFIISSHRNKYFLKRIHIDQEKRSFGYTIVKYNKIYLDSEVGIDELDAKIIEKSGVYKTFLLEIKTKEYTIRQRTIGGWNTKFFKKIIEKIKKIQGKKAHLGFVR